MKTNYTNEQLQAAIDEACDKLAQSTRVYLNALDLDNTTESWPVEAPARLDLIKSVLAALPEPPTVDGKTPGQFYTKRLTDSASAEIPWIEWHGGECPLRDEEVEEWEYKFRQYPNEVTEIARKASSTPNEMVWSHDGSPGDITAYRVLKWREGFGPVDEESMLLNLLAVIHRDGGHYQSEHGTRKAVEDAHKEWARLISIVEETGLPTVDGMSLRDWFAGQALNGYLASWSDDSDPSFFEPYHVAKTSYAYADAMLKVREVAP